MSRVRRAAAAGVVVVASGAIALGASRVLPTAASSGESGSPSSSAAPGRATATVERRTLTVGEELEGTLGYRGERRVVNGLDGTLTRLPEPGTVIGRGEWLFELDGRLRPVLLHGQRPAWRSLHPDVPNGADVQQLEENLAALGFLDDGEVDRDWDRETTEAVEAWQAEIGAEADGEIELGEVVFLDGDLRVTEGLADAGSRIGPGQAVLSGTTTERVVTVDLEADRTDLVAEGDPVALVLPDGSTTSGTVASVGRVATAATDQTGQQGTPTVEVAIALDDPAAGAAWDAAPVEVRVTRETRDGVLTVPVTALLALLEGGYAVEVVQADGSTRLVAVELGIFEGTRVEVRSDELDEGDRVVVPS